MTSRVQALVDLLLLIMFHQEEREMDITLWGLLPSILMDWELLLELLFVLVSSWQDIHVAVA